MSPNIWCFVTLLHLLYDFDRIFRIDISLIQIDNKIFAERHFHLWVVNEQLVIAWIQAACIYKPVLIILGRF